MEHCLTEHLSASPKETKILGERIARNLKPGTVIALNGGLGAGKTCLTKGIAAGLGIEKTITSPTYAVFCEYKGFLEGKEISMYHIDAYRLNGDEDFETTGAGDYIGSGITVIEWSERIQNSVPENAIRADIEITGPQSRIIRINGMQSI